MSATMKIGIETGVVAITEKIRLLAFRSLLFRHAFGDPCFPCSGQVKLHHLVRLAVRAAGNSTRDGEEQSAWFEIRLPLEPSLQLLGQLYVQNLRVFPPVLARQIRKIQSEPLPRTHTCLGHQHGFQAASRRRRSFPGSLPCETRERPSSRPQRIGSWGIGLLLVRPSL